jgi:hypothetical protein
MRQFRRQLTQTECGIDVNPKQTVRISIRTTTGDQPPTVTADTTINCGPCGCSPSLLLLLLASAYCTISDDNHAPLTS